MFFLKEFVFFCVYIYIEPFFLQKNILNIIFVVLCFFSKIRFVFIVFIKV